METIEPFARAFAAFQLLLLAGVFARVRRDDHLAATGVLFCLSLLSFVIASAAGANQRLGAAFWPLIAFCAMKPALLWLFTRALFADRFRLQWPDLAALLGMALLGVWREAANPPGGDIAAGIVSALALGAASLFFVALTVIELYQDQRTDLDQNRRKIRRWVLPGIALYFSGVIFAQAISYTLGGVIVTQTFDMAAPALLRVINLAVILAVSLLMFLSVIRVQMVDWLVDQAKPGDIDLLNANDRKVLARLHQHMAGPRWYADAELSIASFARTLATNEQTLRTVINLGLGYRNFNDFLHQYRLEDVARRIAGPDGADHSVLSTALDAGYRSIGPFNRAFKARYGVTPTEFRRAQSRAADSAVVVPAAAD